MFFGDYTDSPTTPLFPFGHGLGYTQIVYDTLKISATDTASPVQVSMRVTNTGERAALEVVQLYACDNVATVARPDQMLVGFAKVALAPAQTRQVTFTVHPSRLAYYDLQMRFVTEPGSFTFRVGASAADIRAAQTITLSGAPMFYRQREIVATTATIQ